MKSKTLRAFQVGDYDLVAHYSPEEARQLLLRDGHYSDDDITPSEVRACSEAFLAKPTRDEEGNVMPSWGEELEKRTEPGWLGGWE